MSAGRVRPFDGHPASRGHQAGAGRRQEGTRHDHTQYAMQYLLQPALLLSALILTSFCAHACAPAVGKAAVPQPDLLIGFKSSHIWYTLNWVRSCAGLAPRVVIAFVVSPMHVTCLCRTSTFAICTRCTRLRPTKETMRTRPRLLAHPCASSIDCNVPSGDQVAAFAAGVLHESLCMRGGDPGAGAETFAQRVRAQSLVASGDSLS